MDSTLIETEVIDELAERAGVGDAVREITARAMRGEIDFRESFTERVALLKGLDVSVMEEIAVTAHHRRAGAHDDDPQARGLQDGDPLRRVHLFRQLPAPEGVRIHVYANELEIEQGRSRGAMSAKSFDGRRKAELLRLLCQFEEINIAQSVAVGDGANDLPMLNSRARASHSMPNPR